MKIIFFVFFFAIVFTAECQSEKISKRKLYKAFKKSIDQESEDRILTLSNPWKANNDDSVYFKSDTIKLINFTQNYNIQFCFSINWSFYEKDKFFRAHKEDCLANVYANAPEFKISISKVKRDLFITTWDITYGIPVLAERFKVIKLVNNSSTSTLTLLRIK